MLQLPFALALLAASSTPAASPPAAATHRMTQAKTARVEPAKLHRADKPQEARDFFLHKRLPEGETRLPIEKYYAARERMQTMRQHSAARNGFLPSRAEMRRGGAPAGVDKASGGWTSLGPGNVGGRTLALVIDPRNPRTIYAGTADGGIWKTTDAGASWAPVGDLFPSLAIGSLVMDPNDSNVLYAGTGEGAFNGDAAFGDGVFQTTDAGQTWNQLPGTGTADFQFVNKLAISPASGILYAATGTGVWKFDAGAGSWTQALVSNLLTGCQDMVMRVDAGGNDVVFAACGSFVQGGIFRNAQAQVAGSSWQLVLTQGAMGRTSLAIAPSNHDVIYAVSASNADGPGHNYNQGLLAVFRSTTGGGAGTWQSRVRNTSHDLMSTLLLTNPVVAVFDACGISGGFFLNQGWYDNVVAVDPVNSDRIFVGGIDLFRSDDGGRTFGAASYWWAQPDPPYNHADQHALAFHPGYDGVNNQILYIGNDGGVFRTSNPLAQTAKHDVSLLCNDVNSKVVYEGLNNGFVATQFYDGAVFPDGTAYFGGTQDNGTVLGTDQGGSNQWATIQGGDGGFVAVDPTNPNNLYAEFTGLSITKSVDGGHNFVDGTFGIVDFNFLFIAPFVMDATNPKRLWTGGAYLWTTKDGALHWSRASARIAGSPRASVSAVASSPVDANHVLMGTDQGLIHRNAAALSANGNTHWPVTQPRKGFVSWLAFDPANANVAYATFATFGAPHVWKTSDGGATWTGIDGSGGNALPDIPVQSVAIDPATGNLYIGTDMGVFVTTDGGASWAVELTGFPDSVTDAVVVHVDPAGNRSLYAFTHGRGAWRVDLQ